MEINELPIDKKIILFDGVCNLCTASVLFVIQRDKNDIFRFVSLQSELGNKIIKYLGISNLNIDSIVLYEPNKAYYLQAEAALRISKSLGGMYSLLALFDIIPKFISNFVYNTIAKNRYQWYGKKDNCMIPTPELQSKFLA